MRISKIPILFSAILLGLSACGGTTTTSAGGGLPPSALGFETAGTLGSGNWTFSDISARSNNSGTLGRLLSDGTLTIGTPMTPMATYNGSFGIGLGAGISESLVGRMQVTANFGADTINGTAADIGFQRNSGTNTNDVVNVLSGSLPITGTISGTSMSATMMGALDNGTKTMAANMSGVFYVDRTSGKSAVGGGIGGVFFDGGIPRVIPSGAAFQAFE